MSFAMSGKGEIDRVGDPREGNQVNTNERTRRQQVADVAVACLQQYGRRPLPLLFALAPPLFPQYPC